MADASGSFAEVLRHAIEARGLGLERIRDHLRGRGVTVSVATLSYWQSGRSRPERKRSLEALPHLEELLGLPRGALQQAAPRGRGRRGPVPRLDTVWPEPPCARLLAGLDTRWDAELERLSLHDVLTVGPDRAQAVLRVRQVLRARCDGPDRAVVMHRQDDAAAAPPAVRALRGCRTGRTLTDPAAGLVGAELLFWRPLRRGQTVVVEHELLAGTPGPRDTEHTRRLRLPVRAYVLEVRFDAAALPERCHRLRGGADPEPLVLDPAHSVHLVRTDDAVGTTGIGWRWPGPTSGAWPRRQPS